MVITVYCNVCCQTVLGSYGKGDVQGALSRTTQVIHM